MADSFTSRLRLRTPGDGDYEDAGAPIFQEIMQRIDDSIAGTASIAMTDGDYTLSANNGVDDEARKAVLSLSGALTATRNVIVPSISKLYVVNNGTTGGQSVIVKTASGTGVTVPNGKSVPVRCNGTNVVSQLTHFPTDTTGGGGGGGGGGDTELPSDVVTKTATQTLTNKTLSNPIISGQVKAPSGSASAPSYGVNGDSNTGMYFPAADTIRFATGGTDKITIGSTGRLGIGTDSPAGALHLRQASNAVQSIYLQSSSNTAAGRIDGGYDGSRAYLCGMAGVVGGTLSTVWRAYPDFSFHVGAVSTANYHILRHPGSTSQGDRVLSIESSASSVHAAFFNGADQDYSTANCVLRVAANGSTGRSINAAGSVNVNGNDFAEPHMKAPDCGEIKAGDVVGLDENDEVTDKFSRAVAFGVVSTKPGLIGGGKTADDDRAVLIAYCGRCPINGLTALNAKAGDYVQACELPEDRIGVALGSGRGQYAVGQIARIKDDVTTVRILWGA